MKLNFWNWVHLLTPYFGAFYLHSKLEESFLGWLFLCYLIVFFISMVPHMDRDLKTGRSFKTKYGKVDEYYTKNGEPIESQIKLYINFTHLAGIVLLIIYFFYNVFTSVS